MSSLRHDFLELLERIRHGRELGHASFEPVYYLVFHPSQILEVKRQMPAWLAKLHNDGWKVTTFSIAENIISSLKESPLRKVWLMADKRDPLAWNKTNQALANYLTNTNAIESRLRAQFESLEGQENAILIVTDLEALHPYMRIGAIENQLQGKFTVPTVFLYPGERTGKTGLKFLGFYHNDGNYRSVHIGG